MAPAHRHSNVPNRKTCKTRNTPVMNLVTRLTIAGTYADRVIFIPREVWYTHAACCRTVVEVGRWVFVSQIKHSLPENSTRPVVVAIKISY